MRQKAVISMLLVMLWLVMGCATLGITVKPYSEMTAKEKVAFLMKSYNKVYEDYKVQAASPNLTEPEKAALRTKKEVLTYVYPLIQALDLALVEGKPFDSSTEALIISGLRKLGTKIN